MKRQNNQQVNVRRQDKNHRRVRKSKAGPNFSGQHLLHHKGTIERIIDLAQLEPQDTVVEIGPGRGALTKHLIEKADRVIAIEYDQNFVNYLQEKFKLVNNLHIIERDFLEAHLPQKPFRVVANIPYSITTPILQKLLTGFNALQGAVLMMEKGAARRFTANAIKTPKVLYWRMQYQFTLAFEVPADYFSPPPRVASAVVKIEPRERPYLSIGQQRQFMALAAYALKRPEMPLNDVLKGIFTPAQISHLTRDMAISSHQSICTLKEHQWNILFNSMLKHVVPHRWPR